MLNLNKIFDYRTGTVRPFLKHNTFDSVYRDKSSLVVTIGDSWSFGGSLWHLLPENSTSDQINKFRVDSVFGNQLSQMLQADWINISLPAMSNLWMAEQTVRLNAILKTLPYTKIYIVIALTEVGRELVFYKGAKFKNINNLVSELSKQVENCILSCAWDHRCKLIMARTYVNDTYPNLKSSMLSSSWLEVLIDKPFSDNCVFLSMVLDYIEQFIDYPDKKELLQVLESAEKRIELLESSKYNIQIPGYKHPTPEGHKLFANYILNYC